MSEDVESYLDEFASLWRGAKLHEERDEAGLLETLVSSEAVFALADRIAQANVRQMLSANKRASERKKLRTGFERRLRKRWGKALTLFDEAVDYSHDLGAAFCRENEAGAAAEQDLRFEALRRLHARSCAIAWEIHALLSSGHADGATARWRSLYEIAVVAVLLSNEDVDLSNRFLLHEIVVTAGNSADYALYGEKAGLEPQDEEDRERIQRTSAGLVERFGKSYRQRPYGWAAGIFEGQAPGLRQLAEKVNLTQWYPLWNAASDQLHGGSKGAAGTLVSRGPQTYLKSGPTNVGLGEPAEAALVALGNVTAALTLCRQTGKPRYLVGNRVLHWLADEAGAAFVAAHEKLESDERRIWEGDASG